MVGKKRRACGGVIHKPFSINRRYFLKDVAGLFLLSGLDRFCLSEIKESISIDSCNRAEKEKNSFFRSCHGFNLLNLFMVHNINDFKDEEFALISELGFNFVRLPMDYRCWTDESSLYRLKEPILQKIDKAVDLGRKYKIHVCLNFHRAPGWTVADPKEKMDLWEEEEALKACAFHWQVFAERYKGIPAVQLSFNLLNEPGEVSAENHRKVIARLIDTIRSIDSIRPIMCDGRKWGHLPPFELADLGIIASFHMYQPFHLTHYKAEWVGKWDKVPLPEYPYNYDDKRWDKEILEKNHIQPWQELEKKNVPVFVGEFGCYNRTPHPSVMNWLNDCLTLFSKAGWGWAMWNFIGSFGPLNSGREDTLYEDWKGYKVDRQMLSLLQKFAKSN